jgi:hypothetical protein
MSGDTQTSTGTSTTTQSMPMMNDILGWGKSIVGNKGAWAPDTTSHVTPFATQTTAGMTGMTNTANASTPAFTNNFNRVNATTSDGGLNDLQDQQVGRLQGVAGGNGLNTQQQTAYNQLSPMAAGNGYNATQQNAANYLNPIASGASRQNNPYLEDMIKRGSQDIGNAGNLMASSAGRYGSDSHAQALGKNIADFAGNTRFADYNNQNARQDSAINSLFGMGTTGAGQKSGAVNQQFGMGTTGMDQRNDAIGSLYNAGATQRQNVLNGTGQLQDAYQARMDPYKTLMGVGAMNEGLYGRQIADNTRILNEKQGAATAPLDWLAQLAGQFQGGTSVNTGTQPTASPLSQGLGGALTGFAATGNPFGALLGGASGFL